MKTLTTQKTIRSTELNYVLVMNQKAEKELDARNKLVACLLARLLITRAQIPKR